MTARVPVPPLSPDEVHLWRVDLGPQAASPLIVASTSPGERDRAARFRRPTDGERYLTAHGALRLILAGYLSCDPLSLRFSAGEWGKPTLDHAPLSFNLSRSGAIALVAVAAARQVGVDVEQIRSIPDWALMAERVCTPRELAALQAVAAIDRDAAFLVLWTRKEALAKMTGAGLKDMGRDVTLDAQDDCTVVQVHELSGYAACVAAEGTTWRLLLRNTDHAH